MKFYYQHVSEISPSKQRLIVKYCLNKHWARSCLGYDNCIAICQDGNKIIGWCGIDTEKTFGIYVREQYRGKGIGTQLMRFFVDNANGRDIICGSRKEFPAGHKLFKRIERESKGFYMSVRSPSGA